MKVLTVKISRSFDAQLRAESLRSGRTISDLAREALEAWAVARGPTFGELCADLAGIGEGPGDLSTHPSHLEGFGR